jgi:hypothetical protein
MRDKGKVWQKYCGFLDLSVKEFMEIQQHLLLEQIKSISSSPLTKIITNGAQPQNLTEFRQQVPLTRYEDYKPYIGSRQEDYLLKKPAFWARTSGKGGEPKWVPYTREAMDWVVTAGIASLILACASHKGEVRITSGVKVLQNLAPPPYFSGIVGKVMDAEGCTRTIPPIDDYTDQPFEKRTEAGFREALRSPVEVLGSLTAVLIKMGESFAENHGKINLNRGMLHPRILIRLLSAYLRSRKENRPLLPKDLWPLKGLICYGMDTSAYREQIKYYWGKEPLELYSSTECATLALQSWNKKALTFLPFSGFLEFIPEAEWLKNRQDRHYQPHTILLNDLREGSLYEVVFTSFHGMPFLRYRLGDLIKIVSLEDKETGIRLPQLVFQCRADDTIDINGFARLDEKTIWQAITRSGVKIVDWSARKEFVQNKPLIHIYLEPRDHVAMNELGERIHKQILDIHKDYKDLHDMLGVLPVKVTALPPGSFRYYYESRRKTGTDLAHLKPPQMNALDRDIEELLVISRAGDGAK